ncbi:hypothetical protein BST65_01810 [Bradyrhizobium canariense]|nr:hypothetical protein BST65_01810 [Bradyrhizobium canariense]OSI39308.1 hypothetical protein BST66_01575 [Bradyrhizobium canariense]OSI55609.1 hypothetical protein BSZ20_01600 [Bradyrhizobium canariense]OSI57710.1 hypothetical protein BST67_01475 [Bradyrhizobium canariense]OSI60507.1 hypothetical protein BSZ15_01885 [Bradyrhizobium canariense]
MREGDSMGLTLRNRSAKGRLRFVGGECWIDRETSGCQFRDARLGDRFRCSRRLEAPSDKVFRSSTNWANTKAAYRFLSMTGSAKRTFWRATFNRRVSARLPPAVRF